jgi:hypothetical protein
MWSITINNGDLFNYERRKAFVSIDNFKLAINGLNLSLGAINKAFSPFQNPNYRIQLCCAAQRAFNPRLLLFRFPIINHTREKFFARKQ